MKNIILNLILLISISMNSQSIDLINPEKNVGITNWYIVNDDVMGGISKSYLSINEEKNYLTSFLLNITKSYNLHIFVGVKEILTINDSFIYLSDVNGQFIQKK